MPDQMPNSLLILGYGQTARALVNQLDVRQDIRIIATSRRCESTRFISPTLSLIPAKGPLLNQALLDSEAILITAPPSTDDTNPFISAVRQSLSARAKPLHWLGYLSSTAVYGDHDGAWVDESSLPISPNERGLKRLRSEADWLSLYSECNAPAHIFRIAGIYGPESNVLQRILTGSKCQSIVKEGHYFSRIHTVDIARALIASMQYPRPCEIYNLADNYPCGSNEVDQFACDLLNHGHLPALDYSDAIAQGAISPMMASFYADNKRVANQKLKSTLDFTFTYPSYRDGLAALLSTLQLDHLE